MGSLLLAATWAAPLGQSYGRYILVIFRNLHTALHVGYTNLYFYPQYKRTPSSVFFYSSSTWSFSPCSLVSSCPSALFMNVPRSRLPFYTQDHQSHKIAFHSNCKPCQHQTSPFYRDFKQQRPSPLSPPSAFIPSSMPVFCSPALKESLLVMLVILLNDLFAHFFCRFHFLLDFIPLKDYNEHMHKPVSLCIYLISLYLNLLLVSLYPSQDVVCVCECMLAQSCPTFCNLMDCMPPGFSIHGILQGRILEWVAMSFSRGSSRPRG